MPSLVLEGGSFRPLFSAGVMDALLDNDIMFPYCIGVSAGICYGYSYISKQKRRNMIVIEKYRNDKRYMGVNNIFKERSIFGVNFIFSEIPNKLELYDYDTFKKFDGRVVVPVSNAVTGEAEYFDGKDIDEPCTILRATCSIPLVFPAVKIKDHDYYDGGLFDPIPLQKAIEDGNEKHLVLLTNPSGFRLGLEKINIIVAKVLKKRYPKIVDGLMKRHIKYNETLDLCDKLEKEGRAIVLRPDKNEVVKSFEKDMKKLQSTYDHGYNLAMSKMDDIKKLFS